MTNRAQEIFARAYELEAEEREAFLSEKCGEDVDLRQEVEQLLADASRADSFFGDDDEATLAADGSGKSSGKKTPSAGSGGSSNLSPNSGLTEKEGDIIVPYKLLQQIGEGGFGTVWMAEQSEPISRRVALKVIKAGMDTREVLTRFEAERQALAMMDHSNIAKVLDAGVTDSGRPFFAMELVRGIPISQFCDEQRLDTRQRLELFRDVCSAINHAHQKGIIHRDIKPSNVMVTLDGDKPVVKVIDFGIAKATQGKLTDKTLFTHFDQFMGTPAYMSPEQAGLSGLDIDTRSDVYSLGVLLYELLAGRPPFDPKTLISAGYEEMRRIIREVEPPRPSHHLETTKGEDSTRITGTHGAEPRKLSRQVRGELDWIVMKAIEKDRSRRYETANAFASDIGRYLDDEPVQAAAPSAAYKFRKFARRNKAAIGTAALIAVVLVGATGVSTWQAIEAYRARVEAEAITAFITGVFESPDPARDGRTITVAETLDAAAEKLETDLAEQPQLRARLQITLGNTYHALGLSADAIPLQEMARDYFLATFGPEDPNTLTTMNNLAISLGDNGRSLDEAIKLSEEVLARSRTLRGEEHPKTLAAMLNLATFYRNADRRDEAIKVGEQAVKIMRKVNGAKHRETLGAMLNLASYYHEADRREEALKMDEELLPLSRKVNGPGHPDTLMAMANLASSYNAADRREEALKLREEVLPLSRKINGPEHPATLLAMNNLVASYVYADRLDDAMRIGKEVLELCRKVKGEAHPDTLRAMINLARTYHDIGLRAETLKLREEVLPLSRKLNGPEHPDTLRAMAKLAQSYHDTGLREEALELREELLPLSQRCDGPEQPLTRMILKNLAIAYLERGRLDEAGKMIAQLGLTAGDHPGLTTGKEIGQMIVQTFRAGNLIIPVDEPSETAITDYYESHHDQFHDTSVHLRMISWLKSANRPEYVKTLRKKLIDGGDFAAVAKKHSSDSAASKGGDRGWVKRGDLREDLTNVALDLEAGEVSEVIEDDTHYRILKVEERKEGEVLPLSEVRDEIIKTMMKEARETRVEKWIEEAKKELNDVSEKKE